MKTRRIILWISLILVLISIASALYLVHVHYRVHTDPSYAAGCDISATFRCSDVALSRYAVFLDIPAAVWSLLGYLIFLFFLIWGLRNGTRRVWPTGLYWLLTALTLGVTLAFAYIAEMIIGALCIGCMVMYTTNLLLFALACRLLRSDRGALRRDLVQLPSNGPVWVFAALMILLTAGLALEYPHYWEDECLGPNGLPAGFDKDESCWIGSPHAILSITEFSDYQCPFCRKAHVQLRNLVDQYPEKIRITHKHFPLDTACNPALKQQLHPNACLMARMAYCAGRQRQFWAMNDRLYELPAGTTVEPTQLASEIGLDVDRFLACIDGPAAAANVRKDIEEGLRLRLTGTPTFVIDGKTYTGRIPKEVLQPVLDGSPNPNDR